MYIVVPLQSMPENFLLAPRLTDEERQILPVARAIAAAGRKLLALFPLDNNNLASTGVLWDWYLYGALSFEGGDTIPSRFPPPQPVLEKKTFGKVGIMRVSSTRTNRIYATSYLVSLPPYTTIEFVFSSGSLSTTLDSVSTISKTIYMKTIRFEKCYILSIFRSLEPVKQREERIRQGALLHGADARMIRMILVMQEAQSVMTGQAKGDYSISSPLIVLAGVLPQHTASTG
ncbi:hypothetical protein BDZ91DRAFT_769054 [Kalaharituber pfeilii]|nr:hypothetical protein BDZ91DRAFT_769054 [Kalaharituber pfeilii]